MINIVSSDVEVMEADGGATSSVSVCVELVDTDDGLLRDVVLLINTVDETATGRDTIQVTGFIRNYMDWIAVPSHNFSANTMMNIYSSLKLR